MALSVFEDAFDDVFDVAFIVTADTDQAATFKRLRKRFPGKKLISVAPPRRPSSKHLRDLADAMIQLTEEHVDQCVFPGVLSHAEGAAVLRPREYDPPPGWVHPSHRPQRKWILRIRSVEGCRAPCDLVSCAPARSAGEAEP